MGLSRCFVALLGASLPGCGAFGMAAPPPAPEAPTVAPHTAPTPLPSGIEPTSEVPTVAEPIPAHPGDAAPPPGGLFVVGSGAPLALTAPSFPRIDRARGVVTVADTGDDRFAFQSSLALVELRPGAARGRLVFEVFSRAQFEALQSDPPALERAIQRAALVAGTKLGTRDLGRPMKACTVARRDTDDAAPCAAGQSVRCDDLVATFDGNAGALRHAGGETRHPLWAKTALRSPEHATRFEVVACLREASFDAETRTLAALVDRQCVANGGDWCSREPAWTVVTLPAR